ncbi:MAG: ABC transporter ATP-binding protein [Acidobacteriaceae bacterium]|nr:ABC transporter ATP-binding protein [Acidobacteriaceae bacterium]
MSPASPAFEQNAPQGGASAQAAAIEIHDLVKTYNGFHAVDGLSVTVPQKCFFGFLGPNGAGKTTTIKMLIGLAQPDSGTMQVLGLPLPERSLDIRKEIGIVPDDSLLFDYLTGAEYLEFVARLYGLPRPLARERGRELLELFQLSENRRKLIGEYSKGMRKRVAMAAALIHRPRLFLMDEPFEGVDAVGARLMKDILLEQVQRGATVFLTSHVLEVVERLCDQIAIINRGKVVVQGATSELRQQATGAITTLEDVFVNLVGGERYSEKLDWL